MIGFPYWLIFAVPALGVFIAGRFPERAERATWAATGVLFLLAVGLRDNVGGDWATYNWFLEQGKNMPLELAIGISDRGYAVVNWISGNTFGTVHLANTVCAILAVVPLMIFCRSRKNPWLILTVATPYLIVVVFMGYTRQSSAIGLCLLAFIQLERMQFWRAMGLILVASLFHWAALGLTLCVIGLNALPLKKPDIVRSLLFGAIAAGFAWLILYAPTTSVVLSAKVDVYVLETAAREIRSNGALIRLTLTGVSGAAMLLILGWRRSFAPENAIWTLLSAGSVALMALSLFYSTLADRIGLFLLPLQLQVASVVDTALPMRYAWAFRLGVVALYGAVLFVWLSYSDFAQYWLPYDNLLFHLPSR